MNLSQQFKAYSIQQSGPKRKVHSSKIYLREKGNRK